MKKTRFTALAVALFCLQQPVSAQSQKAPVVEEIFVTAQRKSEQIQDVPISMSALGGEFLQQQGVTDLQDVAQYVPNVRIDYAGTYIQPRIRGIATNTVVNRGLALPVGIVIDEVPYARADYFASGLFDIQRVEVLRGPQGQLFGANTTVGLINIATQQPSDEFTFNISAEAGNYERRRYELAVGGPLVENRLNFRIAALRDERDTYVDNTTAAVSPEADKGFGDRERESYRLKLELPDVGGGSINLGYLYDDGHFGGSPREISFGFEKWRDILEAADPNVDLKPGNLVGSLDAPTFRDSRIDTFTASGEFSLGEWGVNLVAGWSELTSDTNADSDNSPLPLNTTRITEASQQMTAEVRLSSPDLDGLFGLGSLFGTPLGNTSFTGGVFYQQREQSPTDAITRLNAPLTLLLTVLASDENLPAPGLIPPEKWESFNASFEQQASEVAAFAQFNWYLRDDLMLLAGIRVSEVVKEASWVQTVESEDGICCIMEQFISSFTGDEDNTERYTAPKVGLKYDLSDDVNFYVTWSKGFQPGGFNNFSNSDSLEARTVSPAYVKSWEVGSKMRLLDGAAELNIGVFSMNMRDLQLFTTATENDGGFLPIAQVTNVGELEVQGLELDFTWLPNHWLSLRGSLGYNDSEYLDFPIATCFTDRPNTDGDGEARCDLSGQQLTQSPKWEASFNPSVRYSLGDLLNLPSLANFNLNAGVGLQYTDDRFLHESNDPRTLQPAYTLVSASLGIEHVGAGWSLSVRGENLTDERLHNVVAEGIPAAGLGVSAPTAPRTIVGTLRWAL